MGRGKKLSDLERGKIQAYYEDGHSKQWIAQKIGRSHKVIRNFLANINTYGMKKSPGRPKKLSSRSERRILAELTNSQKGVRQVRNEIAADVSHVTVWRVAQNSPNVVRQSLRACPNLTDAHKQARIRFAENHITWTHQWNTVVLRVFSLCSIGLKIVFSDEKRFCLDGPDGVHSYWRDLRKDPSIFAKRPMGGGGVMVWAGISVLGRTEIVFVRGKMNSESYQTILEQFLIPFLERWPRLELTFQQDNASVHVSASTRQWLEAKNLPILDWPAKSPDLSPRENVWSMLVKRVYREKKTI